MSDVTHSHPVLRQDGFVLRPSTDADLDQLARWFADPEIFRWWGGHPLSRDVVAAKYTGRRCPRVESYIIELETEPIGYIQYHLEGPGEAGLDMMLLPAFRDRGLGPRAARVMVAHLRAAFGWEDITVDPAQDNPRAIRAWQKAGFVIEREWPDHPAGPALLMRLVPDARPPGWASRVSGQSPSAEALRAEQHGGLPVNRRRHRDRHVTFSTVEREAEYRPCAETH